MGMSNQMLSAFRIFAQKYLDGGRKGIMKGKLHFTKTQRDNWQNLRHFGIITQNTRTGGRGREWHLTQLGADFYEGNSTIKSPCGFMAGETLEDEHPAWATFKGKRRRILINEDLSIHIKKREHYQKEKVGDTLFDEQTFAVSGASGGDVPLANSDGGGGIPATFQRQIPVAHHE